MVLLGIVVVFFAISAPSLPFVRPTPDPTSFVMIPIGGHIGSVIVVVVVVTVKSSGFGKDGFVIMCSGSCKLLRSVEGSLLSSFSMGHQTGKYMHIN